MLKYILPIVIASFILSCTPEENPRPDIEIEQEKTDVKPTKEYNPSSVISRSEEFFDWYLANSRMLHKMRSSCIGAENGYHALDKNKLEAYTDWLTESNFFSDEFIQFEHNRWTTECAEKMREMARKKQHFTGPPPCLFEGDIFLKIHELPTQEMIDGLELSISEQTENSAVVDYNDRSSLNWSFKDGSWKIDAWPN